MSSSMLRQWVVVVSGVACFAQPALSFQSARTPGDCPPAAIGSVEKSYPQASISSCHKESEGGTVIFEVALTTKDGRALEVEVSTDGSILESEEKIDLKEVPAAVMNALTATYPGARATSAEKVTLPDGIVHFELAFDLGPAKREVTFTTAGAIVKEEEDDQDDMGEEEYDD